MAAELTLFQDYDRQEVAQIFAPTETFTPGAGTWGLQGIIRIKDRPGDFVLFVTFGQSTGGHDFDEGINSQGVFRWQSQPKQTLQSPAIRELINHDEALNDVHLLLRTDGLRNGLARPYTYLGRLRRNGYDSERERPVHVAWELIDWPIPNETLNRMDLELDDAEKDPEPPTSPSAKAGLTEIPRPKGVPRGESTRQFQAKKYRGLSDVEAKKIGLAGELLALEHEKKMLASEGRQDLALRVEHVSVTQGDGAGYDIRSFNPDGSDRFVEVKTTTRSAGAEFLISANEVAFSEHVREAFVLFRISSFDTATNSGDFFEIIGPISLHWKLSPTQFRAALP